MCPIPVSYTHLDVYKRQVLWRVITKLEKSLIIILEITVSGTPAFNFAGYDMVCVIRLKLLYIGIKSVSYTHLDVYKRQMHRKLITSCFC